MFLQYKNEKKNPLPGSCSLLPQSPACVFSLHLSPSLFIFLVSDTRVFISGLQYQTPDEAY